MRILITGAGGQIGGDLSDLLRRAGHHVIASDVAAPGPGRGADEWHHLDVTDKGAVLALLRQTRPDRVYHLAAVLSARGEEIPQTAYRVNEGGTFNVLESCREAGVAQLIFTSSIAVFGPGTPDPTPDDTALWPGTMYGVNKASGEMLGTWYHRRHGFDFRAVRFPGLISAAMPGGGTSDYTVHMVVDAVRLGAYEAFCRADTIIPLMYMPDALRALVELADAPEATLTRRVYNIAAFSPTAQQIADAVRRHVPEAKLSFRPDPRRQAILDSWPDRLDDRNARADWGWRAEHDLASMLEDLMPKVRAMLAAG